MLLSCFIFDLFVSLVLWLAGELVFIWYLVVWILIVFALGYVFVFCFVCLCLATGVVLIARNFGWVCCYVDFVWVLLVIIYFAVAFALNLCLLSGYCLGCLVSRGCWLMSVILGF